MLAAQAIRAGDAEVIAAGGIESMSNVPYYVQGAREGVKLGHQQLIDGMIKDGLWDVYNDFHMGNAAELCARDCNISREKQDAFARESYERSLRAIREGLFKDEIVPVEISGRKGEKTVVSDDEDPRRAKFEKV